MTTLMLYGNYTADAWSSIKASPESALTTTQRVAAAANCRVLHFYFALDDFDFYMFVEGPSLQQVSAMRHSLMASGAFTRLIGDPLFAPQEILPFVEATHAQGQRKG